MTEKICKTCKHLLTVTSTSNDVWFECFLAHPECGSVDLTDTCKVWKPVVEDEMNEQNIKDINEIFEKNGIEFNIKKIYKNTHDGEKIEVYTNENPRKKGKIQ